MKKVLINFVTIGSGGIDIPRLLKFKRLNELGFELYLFTGKFIKKIEPARKDAYAFNETIPELKSYPRVKWTKIKFMLFALLMNVRGLFHIRRIFRGNYDIIYSPATVLDLVLIPYIIKVLRKKIRWVSVLDNTVPFSGPGNKAIKFLTWIFFKISLFFLRKADKIFVVSGDLQDFMLKEGFNKDKIILSSNGIENDLIEKSKVDNNLDIDALFVGRINEAKGIYDMLEVLKIIQEEYPDFKLAVMGGGDEVTKRKFREKIKKVGLENNVQFMGFQTGLNKFNIIKSSRCFLFLSLRESFGIALLEAVCSGIPAFAYNLPQFSRIYQNGEIDVSPLGDYELVATKIIRLFKDGDFINEKGRLLLSKYSWDKVAEIEYNTMINL